MRTVIAAAIAALITAACADAPSPVAPAAASTHATAVAPVTPATPPASAAATEKKVDAELIKKAASVGYFPRTRNGVAVFCRTDSDIGTRFTTEKCIKEDQLADVVLRTREVQDNMRKGGACGTPNCGN